MAPRIQRKIIIAVAFVTASLFHIIGQRGDIILQSLQSSSHPSSVQQQHDSSHKNNTASKSKVADDTNIPRLQYIRPPGQKEELISTFEQIFNNELSSTDEQPSSSDRIQQQQQQSIPKSAKEIAIKYGIPETSRDVICNNGNKTTIGWIPSEKSYYNVSASNNPYGHTGKIPRLLFQSWKTNNLKEELCEHVLLWSKMNPDYDYFLFDDDAVDTFIRMEYGKEIFASYACVAVGAAMCDVWRLLVVYLFGGLYFDFDTRLAVKFADWNWGEERDVVTGRSCNAPRKHPGGCAHQWGLV